MKNRSILGLLLVSGMSVAQMLPNAENYIETRTYLEPVTATSSTAKQVHTVQYFDGLGRPKQVVGVKASPTGKDVVTHIEYDGFGRQAKDYLPVPQPGTQNGAIYASPLSNAAAAYGAEKIYSEKIFEKSPLNRILQRRQAGNAWSSRPVAFGYDANNGTEVKKYVATTSWANNATTSTIALSGTYGESQLYKNTVTDEDGNASTAFRNGQGQTLLVRKNDGARNIDTYYVYNEYDQLAFVIPPLAAAMPAPDQNTLDNLCYQYRYDGRNRMVEKKLPGKGWEYMLYDKQDRMVATQDANLRRSGQWLFTKYDKFGRVALTGISKGGDRSPEQQKADGKGSNNVERVSTVFYNAQGMDIQYNNQDSTYPGFSAWVKLLSLNYYDDYPAGSPAIPANILGQATLKPQAVSSKTSTKGLPTATMINNIENDRWTRIYTYYDAKARAIGTLSQNHLGGYTKSESLLDFSGVPKLSKTYHKRLGEDTEKVITETFEYDGQNRLLAHRHKVDGNPEEILAQNEYDEISQLKSKKVGGGLQSIDYKYNIRGWLTDINNTASLGSDLFAYAIRYNLPASGNNVAPRFNGNISQTDWLAKSGASPELRRYSYAYDGLNRMVGAYYSKPNASVPGTNAYNEILGYDLNGNISRLERFGGSDTPRAIKIDDLYYTYSGNRLTSVADKSRNYIGYDGPGREIIYDANGNMIKFEDKKLGQIDYNFLNLPGYLGKDKGSADLQYSVTEYLYRADGAKLRKKHFYISGYRGDEGTTQVTDYLDGFQYYVSETKTSPTAPPPKKDPILLPEDPIQNPGFPLPELPIKDPILTKPKELVPILQFVPTSEGYYDFIKKAYIYNYVDHLGNVRVSYRRNSAGVPEVLEENNYYPFGLRHEGYTGMVGRQAYRYKYNGKELQETGMYDYGARFLMPDIGRWISPDPLSEEFSSWTPYNYAFNNPINIIDPDGREGLGWGLKDGQWHFVKDMQKNDQVYKQGGYTDYRGDGSTVPNVTITNSEAVNTGYTYLGFNASDVKYVDAPQATISESSGDRGFFGNWADSNNFAAKSSYNLVNDAYLFVQGFDLGLLERPEWQNPFGGNYGNLDGSANYNQIDGMVNTVSTVAPFGRNAFAVKAVMPEGVSVLSKMNAAQFSKAFKGTPVASAAASTRGFLNRTYNSGVSWINNQVGNGMKTLPAVKAVGKAIQPEEERK